MTDWRKQELVAQLFLGGKSRADLGFPEKWTHDPMMCIWVSQETYQSEHDGLREQMPFVLSDRLVREMNWL